VRVVELWRDPVKSLQGERLTTAAIGTDGVGRDTSVLKTVQRERSGDLAVGAQVLMAGTVRTGDVLASG
jgi:hypothetical protein